MAELSENMMSAKTTGSIALFWEEDNEWRPSEAPMGSEKKGCRENNMTVAKAAAKSRNINRRGLVRTASRPSYICVAWTSHDEEDIGNERREHKGQRPTRNLVVSGNGGRWSSGRKMGVTTGISRLHFK